MGSPSVRADGIASDGFGHTSSRKNAHKSLKWVGAKWHLRAFAKRTVARKCYGCMSIHVRTKRAKNDTKVIKRDAVSSKNVKNEYGFVLPSLTSLLHTPRGTSSKAVLWITWVKKARQTAPKTCFSENQNATYIKTRHAVEGGGPTTARRPRGERWVGAVSRKRACSTTP